MEKYHMKSLVPVVLICILVCMSLGFEHATPIKFHFHRTSASWNFASAYCRAAAGKLVEPDTSAKLNAMLEFMEKMDLDQKHWIGIQRSIHDATMFQYSTSCDSILLDDKILMQNDQCVSIHAPFETFHTQKCTELAYFICETGNTIARCPFQESHNEFKDDWIEGTSCVSKEECAASCQEIVNDTECWAWMYNHDGSQLCKLLYAKSQHKNIYLTENTNRTVGIRDCFTEEVHAEMSDINPMAIISCDIHTEKPYINTTAATKVCTDLETWCRESFNSSVNGCDNVTINCRKCYGGYVLGTENCSVLSLVYDILVNVKMECAELSKIPNSTSSTTISPAVDCRRCPARNQVGFYLINYSDEEKKRISREILANLTIDILKISAFRNRYMSVTDPRASTVYVGWVACVVMAACVIFVLILDFNHLQHHARLFVRNARLLSSRRHEIAWPTSFRHVQPRSLRRR